MKQNPAQYLAGPTSSPQKHYILPQHSTGCKYFPELIPPPAKHFLVPVCLLITISFTFSTCSFILCENDYAATAIPHFTLIPLLCDCSLLLSVCHNNKGATPNPPPYSFPYTCTIGLNSYLHLSLPSVSAVPYASYPSVCAFTGTTFDSPPPSLFMPRISPYIITKNFVYYTYSQTQLYFTY